jgi:CRISPR-associated protein Cmr4
MTARLTFVHALSPLHAGTGQGAGVIDLPIAREKATGLPFLPGSSLKGTLRACCDVKECAQVFGPDMLALESESNYASSAQFSDQRLLLLPIRSLAGTFAWVTSPYVLRRLMRDIADAEVTPPIEVGIPPNVPTEGEDAKATPPKEVSIPTIPDTDTCAVVNTQSKITIDTTVYLEDLDLKAQIDDATTEWAKWISERVFPNDESWQQMLRERMCVVHDDVFNFMIDTATEITARIKLKDDAKTVQDGGLWYEEALPAETILSGIVLATPMKVSGITTDEVFTVLTGLTGKTLQFGGKATVGRGMCRVQLTQKGV